MTDDSIVVFVTASSAEEAEKIAGHAVEKKLAACASIFPSVRSIYKWKGEINTADEVFLMFKTRKSVFKALQNAITELHSYEVPEIIAMDIVQGLEDYLEWINTETSLTGGQEG